MITNNDNTLIPLSSPKLPQADNNGLIDVSVQQNQDLIIKVPYYEDIEIWDVIVVSVGGIFSRPYHVQNIDLDFFTVTMPFSEIPDGCYNVTYTSADDFENEDFSEPTVIKVINSPSIKLLPSIYPDSTSGVIHYSSLVQHRGLNVHISYRQMRKGDSVIFHWQGHNFNYDLIARAAWDAQPITVSDEDVKQGYVSLVVPVENVLCLGQEGVGTGYYEVGNTISAPGSVILSLTDMSSVMISISEGAPMVSNKYPKIKPKNLVAVYGPPGKSLLARVESGSIVEGDGTKYQFAPDSFGLAYFHLQSEEAGSFRCTVSAEDGAITPGVGQAIFSEWRDGRDIIEAYAFTSEVPADGVSVCSGYVIVDRTVYSGKRLLVRTDGSAIISGFGDNERELQVAISKDGCTTFHITNTKAEKNNVIISLPDIDKSIQFSINFKHFPSI
ncbi:MULTISPECIES: hypothetical protein [Photorhabdus]|uniref:hypothetical protein n=1 Tax=Photorhabdus TaxID=29487 RepID=UPI000DCB475D|nr:MULTISPECIES: hypothetical protein [Photorhabdus]MCT8345302.1 hypothetical protein [Photorhabdus kleinii]RAW93762.1 hypothetical protein CKY03_21810 [Photorhabdus sp. S9-53]RAW93777.1 hypothetical protein CKY05_21870 [Photorhabdus sp. S10-54]RAX05363.1 hypothetical protein CKY04_05715 [Photorhabdus sp. S8-52]